MPDRWAQRRAATPGASNSWTTMIDIWAAAKPMPLDDAGAVCVGGDRRVAWGDA
jgi:hypothetical protein